MEFLNHLTVCVVGYLQWKRSSAIEQPSQNPVSNSQSESGKTSSDREQSAKTDSAVPAAPAAAVGAADRGDLVVRCNVAANAIVDDFDKPDKDGPSEELTFSKLPVGTRNVKVWAAGYRTETQSVTIRADESVSIEFKLEKLDK